jgi:hypothetical protein
MTPLDANLETLVQSLDTFAPPGLHQTPCSVSYIEQQIMAKEELLSDPPSVPGFPVSGLKKTSDHVSRPPACAPLVYALPIFWRKKSWSLNNRRMELVRRLIDDCAFPGRSSPVDPPMVLHPCMAGVRPVGGGRPQGVDWSRVSRALSIPYWTPLIPHEIPPWTSLSPADC